MSSMTTENFNSYRRADAIVKKITKKKKKEFRARAIQQILANQLINCGRWSKT